MAGLKIESKDVVAVGKKIGKFVLSISECILFFDSSGVKSNEWKLKSVNEDFEGKFSLSLSCGRKRGC